MYLIEAIVTTATSTELKVTDDWPIDWLEAPGIRSIEIQRKLLPVEKCNPAEVSANSLTAKCRSSRNCKFMSTEEKQQRLSPLLRILLILKLVRGKCLRASKR
jgi:hypothetical protein